MSPVATTPTPTTNFSDGDDNEQPTWLTGPIASRFRFALNTMFDALGDSMGFALRANLPSIAPPDALPWISSDRQIDRGINETNASFVARLIQYLDLWRYAGNSTGLLIALLGVILPDSIKVRTVSNSGDWRTYLSGANPMPAGATVPVPPTQVVHNNWNWDGLSDPFYGSAGWWRMWIVVYPDAGIAPTPTKVWGTSHTWGDGTAYNWAGSQALRTTWQAEAKKWKAAHCYIPAILVCYDSTLFDPTLNFGNAKLPDGHQGHWGKVVSGVYVPARTMANVSFLDGAI